jgi:hypothetical protein
MFIGQAAEALGAIGLEKSISLLKESLAADPAVEVQETCELALRRIEEQKNNISVESTTISPYLSVDPALPAKQGLSAEQLRYVFEDSSICVHCLWYIFLILLALWIFSGSFSSTIKKTCMNDMQHFLRLGMMAEIMLFLLSLKL